MPEFVFKVLDDVMLAVHSSQPPPREEWSAYVQEHAKLRSAGRKLPIVVFTAGGGPDSAQRAALRQVVPDAPPTAILSRSVFVRGVVTAFNWLGWSTMRSFAPTEIDEALRYVDTKLPKARVLAELKKLQEQLSLRSEDMIASM